MFLFIMRVNYIQQLPCSSQARPFGSLRRDVTNKTIFGPSKLSHRNDTCFFRNDEFWAKLTNFIIDKYKDNIESAISHIEEAISQISYRSNLIDEDTDKVINSEIINKLQDMIYELEEVMDKPIFKPEVK